MEIDLFYWLGVLLLFGGCFIVFSGALGLLRFPDFYTRMHAAGLTDAFGAPVILIGLALMDGLSLISVKILCLIIFLLITSATSTHATAKAAMMSGLKPIGKIRQEK